MYLPAFRTVPLMLQYQKKAVLALLALILGSLLQETEELIACVRGYDICVRNIFKNPRASPSVYED